MLKDEIIDLKAAIDIPGIGMSSSTQFVFMTTIINRIGCYMVKLDICMATEATYYECDMCKTNYVS